MPKYDNSFYNINDLVECLERGCEVEFLYKSKKYSITQIADGIVIYEFNNPESEKIYAEAKDISDHKICEENLSDVVKDLKIIFRTF